MTDLMPEPVTDLDALADRTPSPTTTSGPDVLDAVDEQLLDRLVGQAREGGLQLTGEGGLLAQLTKRLVESALEGELSDHLGYGKHDPAGRDGGNSRNGHRSKTVLTEVGPVGIDVPRDRDGSFEPKIVGKRKRRLSGIDELVLSLSAKGLTTGEVAAHLAEVYGADVSRQTISTITDKVIEGMAEWQNRPLDPGRFPAVVANYLMLTVLERSSHGLARSGVTEDESGSVVRAPGRRHGGHVPCSRRQVGVLGEVLPQQPVGVLVRAPLPGRMRIAEEDLEPGRGAGLRMQRHLPALVPGQGPAHRGRQMARSGR